MTHLASVRSPTRQQGSCLVPCLRVGLVCAVLWPTLSARAQDADEAALRKAVTLYASFDESVRADVGGGQLTLDTRFNHETEKGKFVFKKGFNADIFRIARGGVSGGALEATDVLPRNGRIFFPAKGNLAFKKGGWGGTVSFWINTDPDKLLKTSFCDPVQITQKGATNGGIWFDFNDSKPRTARMGIFPAVPEGQKPLAESDPNAPLVRVPKPGFKQGKWHHIALTWDNLDTGRKDAKAILYIDGKRIGEVSDRPLAMDWEVEKAGIYVAVNYIGLLDELALFGRPLSAAEVGLLHRKPDVLAPLKKAARKAPAAPKFPFDAATGRRYQLDYANWLGLPVEFVNSQGMTLMLVPPGTFLMGSPEDEPGRNRDEARHTVTLTRPFYLGKYEVTVSQFRAFGKQTGYRTDGEKNGGGHAHDERAVWKHRSGVSWLKPGYAGPFSLRDDHPVVHVSHHDSRMYCRWLSERDGAALQGLSYDLPTEAQWEWACRTGSGARFWWGPDEDTTGKVINVGDRTLKRVHAQWPRTIMPMDDGHAFAAPVGSYRPNAFGLHDMLGNVWEFCSTRAGPYPLGPATDPGDLAAKRGFAVRGGGWSNVAADARCATRNADPPHFCHSNLGFRVALPLPPG
ncbi:MAG: SUMF1/EgtB/PvdO family nonheme iron enzyme [Gemmataceae bacterium]|nr:SUMF1/EgtB/PvdO family nonheme iron enzyme [Gemmataceae bacterium]